MDKIAQALRAVMTEIQAMPEPQQPGAAQPDDKAGADAPIHPG